MVINFDGARGSGGGDRFNTFKFGNFFFNNELAGFAMGAGNRIETRFCFAQHTTSVVLKKKMSMIELIDGAKQNGGEMV